MSANSRRIMFRMSKSKGIILFKNRRYYVLNTISIKWLKIVFNFCLKKLTNVECLYNKNVCVYVLNAIICYPGIEMRV